MDEAQFTEWLLDHRFAEERRGYGHSTAEEIAAELFNTGFEIIFPDPE